MFNVKTESHWTDVHILLLLERKEEVGKEKGKLKGEEFSRVLVALKSQL